MIGFRYERWDPDLLEALDAIEKLMKLFHHLLLQSNGDVDEALRTMKRLQEMGYIDPSVDLAQFRESLKEKGIIADSEEGGMKLAPGGERFMRMESLNQIFGNLKKAAFGDHRTVHSGEGGERLPETRPWSFGDETADLDLQRTMHNSLLRSGPELRLTEEDFEISEMEHTATCATVLMVDISHSMILYGEDRITPAKKVALALTELIQTRYPKDTLDVVLFGDEAAEVRVKDLPYIGAGPYHTNTRAGLQLAQRILSRRKHPNRQIFMVTDGKASAVTENGRIYKNPFGMDPKVVSMTLEEAARCRRAGVVITTFMLTRHPELVDFVDKLTRINRGRAYYSSCDDLGASVFVDYVRNRRRKMRS